MTQSRSARVLLFIAAVLSLAAVTSCSKKVSAPDASFHQLEGMQDGKILLVGWQHPVQYSVTWRDPGSPFEKDDDIFGGLVPVSPDSAGRIETMMFDLSIANGLQIYRTEASGALVPQLDYPLAPFLRWLNVQTDVFRFEDALPDPSAQKYVVRGTLNGAIGSKSSISNITQPYGTIDESMRLTSGYDFRDSIATLSWTPDPRAVVYLVNVLSGDELATSRSKTIISNYPSPVYPSASTDQEFYITTNTTLPRDYTGAHFPTRIVLRVFALDQNFRIVNRLVGDTLRTGFGHAPFRDDDPSRYWFTDSSQPDVNVYSAYPAGGARVIFNPFNQQPGPQRAARAAAAPAATYRLPKSRAAVSSLTAAQARALIESRRNQAH